MSLPAYRCRVAELIDSFEAGSRFQAGLPLGGHHRVALVWARIHE